MPADPYGVVYTFALENQKSVRAEGEFVYFEDFAGTVKAWEAGDEAYALSLVAAIKVVMTTPPTTAPFTVTIGVSLAFTSVTPSTSSVGVALEPIIAGSGFVMSGIDTMKADDGSGHVNTWSIDSAPVFGNGVFTIDSDNQITLGDNGYAYPAAGTYTIYYSTNGGGSYTTTGKTIAVS